MIICGLDECGRGPLAGPLVAAAAVFNAQCTMTNLKDSKKLSEGQRNRLYKEIVEKCVWAVEVISVRQINSRGIGWANKEIFRRLIKRVTADKYIVDGNLKIRVRGKSKQIKSMIKADDKIAQVMAASIVAKVTRDEHMMRLHEEHVMYGWRSNKGYGTRYHIQAIREHGPCKHHRRVFVRTALNNAPSDPPLNLRGGR